MLSERKIINYFILGHVADAVITYYALHSLEGFQEAGVAGSSMISHNDLDLMIAKIGITAFTVGFYALTREADPKRMECVGRKAMHISTIILYVILTTNIAQVAPEVIKNLPK